MGGWVELVRERRMKEHGAGVRRGFLEVLHLFLSLLDETLPVFLQNNFILPILPELHQHRQIYHNQDLRLVSGCEYAHPKAPGEDQPPSP